MWNKRRVACVISCVLLHACGASSSSLDAGDTSPVDGADDAYDAGPAEADLAPRQLGPSGKTDEMVIIDNIGREYIRDVPQSALTAMANGPVPLLIVLHGAGDNAQNFYSALSLHSLATRHAFVVVVPQGYDNAWYIQQSEGWPGDDGQLTGLQNDVHLFLQIISDSSALYSLDPKRLYVCGLSRGGAMTGILASGSQNPKVLNGTYTSPFAAYGISSGFDAFSGTLDLTVSGPKRPLWILHGEADPVIPFTTGKAFADALDAAGWPVTFTPIPDAPHTWLWEPTYGQTNDDLWAFLAMYPPP